MERGVLILYPQYRILYTSLWKKSRVLQKIGQNKRTKREFYCLWKL